MFLNHISVTFESLNYSNLNPYPIQESYKVQIRRDPMGGWYEKQIGKGTGTNNYGRGGGKIILHVKLNGSSSNSIPSGEAQH